jgi:hypothetical protein
MIDFKLEKHLMYRLEVDQDLFYNYIFFKQYLPRASSLTKDIPDYERQI